MVAYAFKCYEHTVSTILPAFGLSYDDNGPAKMASNTRRNENLQNYGAR